MRSTRSMIVIGVAAAATVPFLAALATDIDLVGGLTGTQVPTIWAAFSRAEQAMLLVAIGIAVLAAVLTRRSRIGGLVILLAASTGAFLLLQGRADAVTAAESLAADLEEAVHGGLLAWSPGAGPGPGYLAALAGWGVAGLGALFGVIGRGPTKPAVEPADSDVPEGGAVADQRYLDLIIEDDTDSVGE